MPSYLLSLLAETTSVPAWYEMWYGRLAIVAAIFLLPLFLGKTIAGSLRMKDYAWKIALIFFVLFASAAMIGLGEVKYGIDLKGGTILVYELDQAKKSQIEEAQRDPKMMEKLVAAILERVDPSGVKQVTIRPYGKEQIEIIIPEVNNDEVEQIQRRISTAGNLEFRILADTEINEGLVARARASDAKLIKDRDHDALYTNDQDEYWIAEAKKTTGADVEKNGTVRARWVKVEDTDELKRLANDKNIVTRAVEGGGLEKLVMVGQPRAQWVKVGERAAEAGDEELRLRVQPDRYNAIRPRKDGGVDILVVLDELNVNGGYLTRSSADFDGGQRAVAFRFNTRGAKKFGALTSANIPDSGRKRQLGIVLDEELLSAPRLNSVIREAGQITGDFTEAEVDWLVGVLNAGRLPAALDKTPISKQQIDPTLGQITIDAGKQAIVISVLAVLAFMLIYYRFSGVVACGALLLNLLLVLGVMIAIGAAFTLSGLAGLVLTIGMAVDANVLIFERIREELNRGAALRMAIRNGFGRATRTIVDANLTTLITGIILYVIGTDQIRGFAVTLILGIMMSMFTAIFCSRVVFDISERKGWLTKMRMMRLLGATQFNFLSKRYVASVFSIGLISLGLFGVYQRGAELFDIDFRGGSKIEVVFNEVQPESQVRDELLAYNREQPKEDRLTDLKIVGTGGVDSGTGGDGKHWNVETTQKDIKLVEAAIKTTFKERLKTNHLEFSADGIKQIPDASNGSDPVEASSDTEPGADETPAEDTKEGESGDKGSEGDKGDEETSPAVDEGSRLDLPASSLLAQADATEPGQPDATATDAASAIADPPKEDAEPTNDPVDTAGEKSTDKTATPSPKDEPSPSEDVGTEEEVAATETVEPSRFAGGSEVPLAFADPINQETLVARIQELVDDLQLGSPGIAVSNPKVEGTSIARKREWNLKTTLSVAETGKLLTEFQTRLTSDPVFPSSTQIGSQVAGDARSQAWVALMASLVFIIAYIWIRFQRVAYGLAAVVALVHDVLVTLGIIALSAFVASIPAIADPLQLEAFKISLPILAAFLTIIGYSLNDTIVVFDRIREVRGKSPDLTADMINASINQTLGRTLLTSTTTLIVVLILYFWGGAGIHGFAFALVVGVLIGTYSSVFVASPVLLWMSDLGKASAANGSRSSNRQAANVAG